MSQDLKCETKNSKTHLALYDGSPSSGSSNLCAIRACFQIDMSVKVWLLRYILY